MIYVGIDDTDTLDTAGTNQLARAIAERLADRLRCVSIVRHQLFFDPRVPYTSKNGSASLRFEPLVPISVAEVITAVRHLMQEWFVEGSDPGLAVAEEIAPEVTAYALRCKSELIEQREAREIAARHSIHLEGLGGTEGGVIGALAAIGLIVTENDGRVVQWQAWPDDLLGVAPVETIRARGVEVLRRESREPVRDGMVDLGKKLRPNLVARDCVLWVAEEPLPESNCWQALKLV